MVRLVEFEEPAASLVRLVEDTAPESVIDAAIHQLRLGAAPGDLIAAAGLAVSCSTELPPGHHGGPVHPVSGLYAAGALSDRLQGDQAFLPALQSVALANKHIHTTYMGPSAMTALDISSLQGESKETLLGGLAAALSNRRASLAEHHLLALLGVASRGEIMQVLLEVALPRNALDDIIFCILFLLSAVWTRLAGNMQQCCFDHRFATSHAILSSTIQRKIITSYDEGTKIYQDPDYFDRQAKAHRIDLNQVTLSTEADESAAIAALGENIGAIKKMPEVTELMLSALAKGLSLHGIGEALSIGGAHLFLRSHTGNPFDVHIHTGINARRYLLDIEDVAVRSKALGLLSWPSGVEVRYLDETFAWRLDENPNAFDGGVEDTQGSMLAAIEASIKSTTTVRYSRDYRGHFGIGVTRLCPNTTGDGAPVCAEGL